eukprot:TRINITY_DN108269_c0_g1_i1.p1 TRINITY_DN108269_c0_g1~~TRINITY_DN108269_c0_g1_i1.p1  ORF type:complete len:250 (+),score=26.79 TRINITY_DN108269_c0_g1_i1:101-751(+)
MAAVVKQQRRSRGYLVPDEKKSLVEEVISFGSVGHPVSCAGPCPHINSKDGCRDGMCCAYCHRCCAGDDVTMKLAEAVAETALEVAQHGPWIMPAPIGLPMIPPQRDQLDVQYASTYLGSRSVDPFPPDHVAFVPVPVSMQPVREAMTADAFYSGPREASSLEVSLGSRGHPSTCNAACKFAKKPRGCKDGALCAFCHLCRWTRRNHLQRAQFVSL